MDFPFLPDHNELIRIRYEKIQAMREAGLNPFPNFFEEKDTAAAVMADAEALLEPLIPALRRYTGFGY